MYKNIFKLFIWITLFSSCNTVSKEEDLIDFSDTTQNLQNNNFKKNKAVYIAISSMTSPRVTYAYYSDLIQYISNKIGQPIYIKQKKTYQEVNELLERSEVDFAFICSGSYINEIGKNKIKLLVGPQINDKTYYQAYIIANNESDINSFADFKGTSFAYTDPLSTTGRLYPLQKLDEIDEKEYTFFSKTVFTSGHDVSIQMVNRHIIDGASVHGLIFDYLKEKHPDRVENIKIIEKSDYFGIPPVVVPITLSDKRFQKYQEVFLNIQNDSVGKKILKNLSIQRFVVLNDSIYKSVFELKKFIDEN